MEKPPKPPRKRLTSGDDENDSNITPQSSPPDIALSFSSSLLSSPSKAVSRLASSIKLLTTLIAHTTARVKLEKTYAAGLGKLGEVWDHGRGEVVEVGVRDKMMKIKNEIGSNSGDAAEANCADEEEEEEEEDTLSSALRSFTADVVNKSVQHSTLAESLMIEILPPLTNLLPLFQSSRKSLAALITTTTAEIKSKVAAYKKRRLAWERSEEGARGAVEGLRREVGEEGVKEAEKRVEKAEREEREGGPVGDKSPIHSGNSTSKDLVSWLLPTPTEKKSLTVDEVAKTLLLMRGHRNKCSTAWENVVRAVQKGREALLAELNGAQGLEELLAETIKDILRKQCVCESSLAANLQYDIQAVFKSVEGVDGIDNLEGFLRNILVDENGQVDVIPVWGKEIAGLKPPPPAKDPDDEARRGNVGECGITDEGEDEVERLIRSTGFSSWEGGEVGFLKAENVEMLLRRKKEDAREIEQDGAEEKKKVLTLQGFGRFSDEEEDETSEEEGQDQHQPSAAQKVQQWEKLDGTGSPTDSDQTTFIVENCDCIGEESF